MVHSLLSALTRAQLEEMVLAQQVQLDTERLTHAAQIKRLCENWAAEREQVKRYVWGLRKPSIAPCAEQKEVSEEDEMFKFIREHPEAWSVR